MSRPESRGDGSGLRPREGRALGPHLVQFGSVQSSDGGAARRLMEGRLEATELVRCNGLRGLLWLLLFLLSVTSVGRLLDAAGLEGG